MKTKFGDDLIYKRQLSDILQDIVDKMIFTITINTLIDLQTPIIENEGTDNEITYYQYIIAVDDVYYAQSTFPVTIGTNEYQILEVKGNSLKIKGLVPPAVDTFELYRPKFYFGTPKETNIELKQEALAVNKTPMIWLLQTFEETFNENQPTPSERMSDIRLFFLTQLNHKENTRDVTGRCIKPMSRLKDLFYNAIEDNGHFRSDNQKTKVIIHNKLGVYIPDDGYKKSILVDELSGIECPMTLDFDKNTGCENTDNIYLTDESGNAVLDEDNNLIFI